jgi:RimJ/RimL family protein N-acetyltransferase
MTTKTTRPLPELLYDRDKQVADWVAERIPDVAEAYNNFGECRAIGVLSDSKRIICGVVFHDYAPIAETMQLSVAASNPMWARKETIKQLLSYPFEQLNLFKCWLAIAHDNLMSLRTSDHIGFKHEATMRHQFGKDRHAILKRMFKPNYEELYGDIGQ